MPMLWMLVMVGGDRVGGFHALECCYALDVCLNVCCSKIRDYLGR
jgi:hypothetical protein